MTRISKTTLTAVSVGALAAVLVACASSAERAKRPPLELAANVDLARFMGDWYVIASIPTMFEKGAHDAVESYRLAPDRTVDILFRYRDGSFEGAPKEMTSRGLVEPANAALWRVRFFWPIEADYRIAYVADDYSTTVIAREKRDYVWIMARTPTIGDAEYARLARFVESQGYDLSKLQRVPQRPAPRR